MPPIDDSANGDGHLQRSHGGGALADGHRDGLARIPVLAEVADLPLAGGHQPFGLVRKIDAGLVAIADHLGVLRDAIDAQPVAHVVEERVAGLHQALVQIQQCHACPST